MIELISTEPAAIAAHIQATAERANDYRVKAKAENTRLAYHADWKDFTAWCQARTRGVAGCAGDDCFVHHGPGRTLQA